MVVSWNRRLCLNWIKNIMENPNIQMVFEDCGIEYCYSIDGLTNYEYDNLFNNTISSGYNISFNPVNEQKIELKFSNRVAVI